MSGLVQAAWKRMVSPLVLLTLLAPFSGKAEDESRDSETVRILSGVDEYGLRRASLRWTASTLLPAPCRGSQPALPTSIAIFASPARPESLTAPWLRVTDRVERDLTRRALGTPPAFDLGAPFRNAPRIGRARKRRVRELPVPSLTQAAVLAQLWERGAMTSLDLYATLDAALLEGLTAETFWQELHWMAAQGLLEERVVSPQNLMLVGLGPVAVPVEMSEKNRRNRIFLYRPLVDREAFVAYLDARRFLASRGSAADTSALLNHLERVLMILARPGSPSKDRP
ncbi:MAG: hypothetical protein ONB23_11800 [candidate division KSB1 bacterium]|nr:hypothetical protein [candidate division KSB1 bacterium]